MKRLAITVCLLAVVAITTASSLAHRRLLTAIDNASTAASAAAYSVYGTYAFTNYTENTTNFDALIFTTGTGTLTFVSSKVVDFLLVGGGGGGGNAVIGGTAAAGGGGAGGLLLSNRVSISSGTFAFNIGIGGILFYNLSGCNVYITSIF